MAHGNSSTIFVLQKKYDPCKQDSFEYCYTFLYQLVKPFIQSRSSNGHTTLVRQKIELVIGKRQWEVEGDAVGPPMSNLAGVGHKLKRNQMYKMKTLCRICKKHACKDRLIATCEICREHHKKYKLKYILQYKAI